MTLSKWMLAVFAALAVATTARPARAVCNPVNPNNRDCFNMCFSPGYAAWRNFGGPNVDGDIDNDQGWSPAYKYVWHNASPNPDVVLYAEANKGNQLNLGVSVRNDTAFDTRDGILILFDYGNGSYGKIELFPIQQDIQNQTGTPPPGYAHYFTTNDPNKAAPPRWNSVAPADPAWLVVSRRTIADGADRCTTTNPGSDCRWDVELRIDQTKAGAPPNPKGIFIDVLRAGGSDLYEFTWPPGPDSNPTQNYTYNDLDLGTPPKERWGSAAVGTTGTCNGVWFRGMDPVSGGTDITATPASLKAGVMTTLTVKVHNSTINGSNGTGQPATGVQATFYSAPFGSNSFGAFTQVPNAPGGANPNPTSPAIIAYDGPTSPTGNPPPGAGTNLSVNWVPTNDDVGHRCIRVQLTSNDNNTTFINQGEFQNMWVDHSSRFDAAPIINLKGVPNEMGLARRTVRVTRQTSRQYAVSEGQVPEIPRGRLVSQTKQIFHSAYFTGRHLNVKGQKLRVWAPLTSYGFLIQHELPRDFQKEWQKRHVRVLDRYIKELGRPTPITDFDPATLPAGKLRQLNTELLRVEEKPAATDWSYQWSGGKALQGGNAMELEIPASGQARLPTTVEHSQKTIRETPIRETPIRERPEIPGRPAPGRPTPSPK